MNLVLHQFKTDVRHFRWRLAILWLAFAAGTALAGVNSLAGTGSGIANLVLQVCQAVLALALVASLIQADPLVGTGAPWLTRPIRRVHVFWAKTSFIIFCLFVPRLALQVMEWILRGYSPNLGLAAAEESLLFSVACVLMVATLAALTPDLGRFFLAIGITIAGIFASALIVEILVHASVLHQANLNWPVEDQRIASARTVAWLVLGAGGLGAWLLQARLGLRRAAIAGLAAGFLAFPVITTVWSKNFLAPKLRPSVPLTVSVLETNRRAGDESRSQTLSTELAVGGVPAHHVAVMQEVSANILFQGDRKATRLLHSPGAGYRHRTRPVESSQQNNYFDAIGDFFPAETIWFRDNFSWVNSAFYDQNIHLRFPKGPPAGELDGQLTVDLFGVKKVAEAPLRFATFQALPGLRVTLQKVWQADGIIHLTIDECSARLMFDRNAGTAEPGGLAYGQPFCTYVLYHPSSGEAFVVSQRNAREFFPALLSGEGHLALQLSFPYPALRERLAGVTAADWLREARLWIFVPVYAGTSRLAFHQDHYAWPASYDGNVRRQKEKLSDAEAIAQATLPENPTIAQCEAYLDEILLNVPDNWDTALRQTVEKKLAALEANGLPALLRRLPLAQNLECTFVLPTISKLITRHQLPELQAALRRDREVVNIFREKHWEADARAVLAAKLADHREPMGADELRIVAEAKDPATYPDLRWHFVHLEYGKASVIGALEQCPGFDAAGAVREAWKLARLGVTNPGELAAVAAKEGLPDALNLAVVHAGGASDSYGQQHELSQLASLTGYAGPTNSILPWLTSNLEHFRFDPAQQHYSLAPTP